jgi:nucleoside-diphosphate-sugar epimerase
MLRNVLDVCANRDLKLVYAACWEVYSGYSGCLLADEATPRLPRGPYGEAKYLAEMLIEHWMRTRGLRCAMLRSSAVYGEGGDRPKFMHNFFGKILRGEKIVTHHYRTGDARLDLLHVEDFASAVAAALRADFVGVLNIGTGTLTSTFDLAARLSNLQGRSTDIERIDIDADSASIAMNWRRAEAEVGWRPRVTLEQGLQRLFPHVTERPLRS